MISKDKSINKINKLIITQSKPFFLKYLHSKGYIIKENDILKKQNNKNQTTSNKINSIDLKELLDEKKINITIRDIVTDYQYFKHRYYKIDSKDYLYEYNQNPKEKEFLFPFTRENISLEKIYKYFIFQGENKTRIYDVMFYALVFSLLNFILYSKLKYKEIKNYEKSKNIMDKIKSDEKDMVNLE